MSIVTWIVLGLVAGYLAGFLVHGDEGLGLVGHIVLGIVGAVIGGVLATAMFGLNPVDGPLDIGSIATATFGAIVVILLVDALSGRGWRRRTL